MRRSLAVAAFVLSIAPAAFAYRTAAWIPPWDANALASIQSNLGAVNESNPVWFSWNADSSIARNWNSDNSTWRAAMTGTLLIPTVQNVVNHSFDGNAASAMLSNPQTREAHAEALVQIVMNNVFDGIDVDYERIPTASRGNFTAFLTSLSQKLHAANKKLSVTVYAKTSDAQNWNGPGAEDWQAIGQIADSVKIMAYDYSYSTSAPGPIAPLDWLDKVATYAESAIPAAKIFMGLPWYGYDWRVGAATQNMTFASATQLAQINGATITHDVNGEATFSITGHTVYFQDATSFAAKLNMLRQKHPAIGGFAAWAAGVEDPSVWNVLRASNSSPATPPPALAGGGTIRHRAAH